MMHKKEGVRIWECPNCGELNKLYQDEFHRVRPRAKSCDHCDYVTRYIQE